MLEKSELSSDIGSITTKEKHRAFGKGNRKMPGNVFMIIIAWMIN